MCPTLRTVSCWKRMPCPYKIDSWHLQVTMLLWNVRKQLPSDLASYPTGTSLQPHHCKNVNTDVSCIRNYLTTINCITYVHAKLNCPKNNNRNINISVYYAYSCSNSTHGTVNPPHQAFNYVHKNRREQLYDKCKKSNYTQSGRKDVAAYEKYRYCLERQSLFKILWVFLLLP